MASHRLDAGYTLTEMLAALLILGLTMEGVFQAGDLLERQQRRAVLTSHSLDVRRNSAARLQDLLDTYQLPHAGRADLQGDESGFEFVCGQETCGAHLERNQDGERLRLAFPRSETFPLASDDPHFVYVAVSGETESWPHTSSTNPERLRAVLLLAGKAASDPVATAKIWPEEQAGCHFDTITRACRNGAS